MHKDKSISPSMGENQLKGVKALADFLNCSPTTARKLRDSGKIQFYNFGRVFLFDKAEVLAAIAKGGQL